MTVIAVIVADAAGEADPSNAIMTTTMHPTARSGSGYAQPRSEPEFESAPTPAADSSPAYRDPSFDPPIHEGPDIIVEEIIEEEELAAEPIGAEPMHEPTESAEDWPTDMQSREEIFEDPMPAPMLSDSRAENFEDTVPAPMESDSREENFEEPTPAPMESDSREKNFEEPMPAPMEAPPPVMESRDPVIAPPPESPAVSSPLEETVESDPPATEEKKTSRSGEGDLRRPTKPRAKRLAQEAEKASRAEGCNREHRPRSRRATAPMDSSKHRTDENDPSLPPIEPHRAADRGSDR